MCTPYNKVEKEKLQRKKLRPLSTKIVLASEYYLHTCVPKCSAFHFPAEIYFTWKLSPLQVNFSIKILARTTSLFWILLCYLLNMLSFCIGIISWCCFVVPYPLLFSCSTIPWYSDCFASVCCFISVPVFHQCSVGVQCSLFWCSWFYSMP